MKTSIRRIQHKLGLQEDGILGPATLRALCRMLGIHETPIWPTQAEVRQGSSIFGRAGDESKLCNVTPPYPLLYEGKPVRSIRLHRIVAEHVESALREVLAHYGQKEIQRLGLDLYGGSYNYRSCAASKSLSLHAWGIALDFAPEQNALRCKAPRASLSRPECEAWWQIWESHGAVSLGRERDYDWMHLQFARLC